MQMPNKSNLNIMIKKLLGLRTDILKDFYRI